MSQTDGTAELRAELSRLGEQLGEVSVRATRGDDVSINNLRRACGYYVDKGRWDEAAYL